MSLTDQLLGAEDSACLDLVIDFYHQSLLTHEDAKAFLDYRKLLRPDLLETYRIGFSDRSLGKHIPKTHYKAGRKIRDKFKQLGITKSNGIETHRGGITIPITDTDGNIVNIYSHKISNRLRPGTPIGHL